MKKNISHANGILSDGGVEVPCKLAFYFTSVGKPLFYHMLPFLPCKFTFFD